MTQLKIFSVIKSLINKKPITYVIGDSHSNLYLNYKNFLVYHLGPATANSLHKNKSKTNSNKKIKKIIQKINRKDWIILIFGEIDCRIHIYPRSVKNKEKIEKTILTTIKNYGKIIKQIKKKHGKKLIICGVPPTSTQKNIYKIENYPNLKIRCKITKNFNINLKKFCYKNKINFLDIYTKFKNDSGCINKKYTTDSVHLNKKALPVIEKQIELIFNDN